jgi:hypothetical protein
MRRGRVAKWVGTVACLVLVALFAVSWAHMFRRRVDVIGHFSFMVWDGAAAVIWSNDADLLGDQYTLPELLVMVGAWEHPWHPSIYGAWNPWGVYLPLWVPFIMAVAPTGWLWWRDRRRIPAGHCRKCGYDLTGNVSGRCPECGVPTGAAVPPAPGE